MPISARVRRGHWTGTTAFECCRWHDRQLARGYYIDGRQQRLVPVRRFSHFSPENRAGQGATFRELLETSKFRRSSVGWNPVHRNFKNLDGLGPSHGLPSNA